MHETITELISSVANKERNIHIAIFKVCEKLKIEYVEFRDAIKVSQIARNTRLNYLINCIFNRCCIFQCKLIVSMQNRKFNYHLVITNSVFCN